MSQHYGYKLRKLRYKEWAGPGLREHQPVGVGGSAEAIQVRAALKAPRACVKEQRGTSSRAGGPGSSPSSALPRKALRGRLVSSRPPGPSGGLSPTSTLPEPTLASCLSLTSTVPRVPPFTFTAPSLCSSLCPLLPLLPPPLISLPLPASIFSGMKVTSAPFALITWSNGKGKTSPPVARHGAEKWPDALWRRAEWPRRKEPARGPRERPALGGHCGGPRLPTRPHSQ